MNCSIRSDVEAGLARSLGLTLDTCAICSRCFCDPCTLPPRLQSTYSLRRHTCEKTVLLLAAAKLRLCGRVIPLQHEDDHISMCWVQHSCAATTEQQICGSCHPRWIAQDIGLLHLSRICTYLMHMSGGVKGHAVSTVSVSVSSTATCSCAATDSRQCALNSEHEPTRNAARCRLHGCLRLRGLTSSSASCRACSVSAGALRCVRWTPDVGLLPGRC